eukprot:gene24226-biopygen5897
MDWRRGICSPRGDVTRGDVTRGDVTRGDVTRGDVTRKQTFCPRGRPRRRRSRGEGRPPRPPPWPPAGTHPFPLETVGTVGIIQIHIPASLWYGRSDLSPAKLIVVVVGFFFACFGAKLVHQVTSPGGTCSYSRFLFRKHGNWEHFIRTCTDHANNTWGGTGTGADRTRTGRGPRDKNIKGTDVGRTRARPLLHLKCHILKTHTFAHVRPTFGAEARACGSGMCPSCGGGGGSAGCEPVRNAVPGTI